jgi:hypothetical protein
VGRWSISGILGFLIREKRFNPHWQAMSYERMIIARTVPITLERNK